MEVIQLFATQIELVSQRVRAACCCTKLRQTPRYTSLQKKYKRQHKRSFNPQLTEAEYADTNRSFVMKHRGATSRSICTTEPACDRATRRLLISHFALTLIWHLLLYGCFFKLACTQGSTLPVNIKSRHKSLKQTWRDK